LSSPLPWYLRNVNQIGVVAFIQETTSKAVHQAAYSAPLSAQPTNDASTTAITGITTASCNTSVTPSVTIKNLGSTTMTSAVLSYDYDVASNWYYTLSNTIPWSGSLAVNGTTSVALPTATLASGPHTLRVNVISPNGAADINPNNSLRSVSFSIFPTIGGPTPIVEGYQAATFPPTNWVLNNPDNGFTWSRYAVGGFGNSSYSAKMDFYSSASGQIDELYMPALDLSNTTQNVRLIFDHAYAQYTTENDKLEVQVSTNCGTSWTSLFNKAGANLMTHAAVGNMAFVPTAADWKYDTVSLDTYRGNADVLLKFKATSNYGNNLYVDDINLSYYSTLSVQEINSVSAVQVYPNPSKGDVKIDYNFSTPQNVTVTVSNVLGSVVQSHTLNNVSAGTLSINMNDAAKGTYFVTVRSNNGVVTRKISIVD
jgi:hypothetical protein